MFARPLLSIVLISFWAVTFIKAKDPEYFKVTYKNMEDKEVRKMLDDKNVAGQYNKQQGTLGGAPYFAKESDKDPHTLYLTKDDYGWRISTIMVGEEFILKQVGADLSLPSNTVLWQIKKV